MNKSKLKQIAENWDKKAIEESTPSRYITYHAVADFAFQLLSCIDEPEEWHGKAKGRDNEKERDAI